MNKHQDVSSSVGCCQSTSKAYPKPLDRPECQVCFLTLPISATETCYMHCCGQMICNGCITGNCIAMKSRGEEEDCCPFCRTTRSKTDEETVKRLEQRIEDFDDRNAMYTLAFAHRDGKYGLPKDPRKETGLIRRAADLGHPVAAFLLALRYEVSYPEGGIPEANPQKNKEYLEVAAYKGAGVHAWTNLGSLYLEEKNLGAAAYHFRVAASYGCDKGLNAYGMAFRNGVVSKEVFSATLRAWQKAKDDMKSENRENAKDGRWETKITEASKTPSQSSNKSKGCCEA